MSDLVEDLLAGKHSALARVITQIENRSPGYREIISDLHQHTGTADVIGVTGSPGAGKSTLVDKVAATYRKQGLTVGVIAIDPSSPFSGGAVLGDRIRMASNAGDMDMFFRSMAARGSLGGLSTATTDAVTALDAFVRDEPGQGVFGKDGDLGSVGEPGDPAFDTLEVHLRDEVVDVRRIDVRVIEQYLDQGDREVLASDVREDAAGLAQWGPDRPGDDGLPGRIHAGRSGPFT
jgi:energy-coupling factor transporter ATP-binding protein EcfA2